MLSWQCWVAAGWGGWVEGTGRRKCDRRNSLILQANNPHCTVHGRQYHMMQPAACACMRGQRGLCREENRDVTGESASTASQTSSRTAFANTSKATSSAHYTHYKAKQGIRRPCDEDPLTLTATSSLFATHTARYTWLKAPLPHVSSSLYADAAVGQTEPDLLALYTLAPLECLDAALNACWLPVPCSRRTI
jgi:hypothetical protein